MQVENKMLDDLTRVVSGAMGTIFGVREEVEAQIRQQFERVLARMDVVTREEFEAVRAMAAKARDEQEAMAGRLAELERRLAETASAPARAAAAKASTGTSQGAAKPARKRGGATVRRTTRAKKAE
ncbi:MAG TPA: accessory factor UbiK family protein [Alphaproteobacteria bacterium]|nr:accessory factor UbiK family protein [Alphaproteobacteria bacterium]